MALLHAGEKFPALTVALPGGDSLHLPEALDGHFGVILFYRGSWCPYCNAQLRAFQRAKDSLARAGAKVVALSVENEATTAELIARHGLQFPVGHSADARALAEAPSAALLVSSNTFDIAGAAAMGIRTAWCRRQPAAVFDPWGPPPDYVITGLSELAGVLAAS